MDINRSIVAGLAGIQDVFRVLGATAFSAFAPSIGDTDNSLDLFNAGVTTGCGGSCSTKLLHRSDMDSTESMDI